MTTFKVGDRVRLPLEKPTTHPHNPGWTTQMNIYLGKETFLTYISSSGMFYVEIDSNAYYWHPDWLTLIVDTPGAAKTKVLARSLKLEKAFKDRQKTKKTTKPTVISIDRYPLSF